MTLQDLLNSRYVRGGRGPVDLDCYGLVRLARVYLFGKPMLPRVGQALPGDFRAITHAVDSVAWDGGLLLSAARPGAIATAWRASLCVHFGILIDIDGRLMVLETDDPMGPCLTTLKHFTTRYTRVLFYDDSDLPQSAAR